MSDQELHPDHHPLNQHIPLANRSETIYGTAITFLILAVLAVGLRLYVRCRSRLWGYDDLFVFVALIAIATGTSLTCLMPDAGMGKHFNTLTPGMTMKYYKLVWSTNVCYTASTSLIKLSILTQYLRLFDLQLRLAKRLTWLLIIIISAWGIASFFFAVFPCTPIRKYWDTGISGKCMGWGTKRPNEMFAMFAAHAASNMLLDILVLGLPLPFLSSLRKEGRTRIGLIALFLLGGIAASLSIARMVALCLRRAGTIPNFDPSWATPSIYIFSVCEVNIAILCASIPIFWPLVTSLSTNKILVVNEIEVRTDNRDSVGMGLGLAEQGGAFGYYENGNGSGKAVGDGAISLDDKGGDKGGRSSRMSVVITAMPDRVARSASRLHKHQSQPSHTPKKSSTTPTHSSSQSIELISHRSSIESSRHLPLSRQHSHNSYAGSESGQSSPDLDAPAPMHRPSMDHYRDRYVQGWVVPDFGEARDGGGNGAGGNATGQGHMGTTTTTVERAQVPFDYLKVLEK